MVAFGLILILPDGQMFDTRQAADNPASNQSPRMQSRAVLTLAAGKPVYWQMAINLARSFLWWHNQSDIRFYIVTDLPDKLPADLSGVELVRVSQDTLGKGFSAKLHLDELSPAMKTLFIDADCLIVGNLESVFDRFAGRAVSVVGGSISSGEWFGDVAALCLCFRVASLPKFNGGIYYLEQGAISKTVYKRARELEQDYDKLGLIRLRGRPNDELLMAIAMALHGLESLPEDGTIMGDLYSCPELLELDVLRGKAILRNPPPPNKQHRNWYPAGEIKPVIAHFLGDFTTGWQYQAEAKKLRLVIQRHWSMTWANIFVALTFSYPQQIVERAKNVFRPLFHATFGPRSVARTRRI